MRPWCGCDATGSPSHPSCRTGEMFGVLLTGFPHFFSSDFGMASPHQLFNGRDVHVVVQNLCFVL